MKKKNREHILRFEEKQKEGRKTGEVSKNIYKKIQSTQKSLNEKPHKEDKLRTQFVLKIIIIDSTNKIKINILILCLEIK